MCGGGGVAIRIYIYICVCVCVYVFALCGGLSYLYNIYVVCGRVGVCVAIYIFIHMCLCLCLCLCVYTSAALIFFLLWLNCFFVVLSYLYNMLCVGG